MLSAWFELLRIRQWVKNGFVLAPLFFGARLLDATQLVRALSAFAIFCAISGAVYIFNDWRDLEADRHHATKKKRPLASGRIGSFAALAVMIIFVAAAYGATWLCHLPIMFAVILTIYIAVNLSYSLGLKQVPVLELFLVSSGFVLRLAAGGTSLGVELSPWILVATGTLALLITVGKRRGDIARANDVHGKRKSLAGYSLGYLDAILSALTGATLVVYLLFCTSNYAEGVYGKAVLLTAIPVTIGLMRYLQLVMVYGDGDAPTDLLLKDKSLMAVVVVFMATFGLLIYLK